MNYNLSTNRININIYNWLSLVLRTTVDDDGHLLPGQFVAHVMEDGAAYEDGDESNDMEEEVEEDEVEVVERFDIFTHDLFRYDSTWREEGGRGRRWVGEG